MFFSIFIDFFQFLSIFINFYQFLSIIPQNYQKKGSKNWKKPFPNRFWDWVTPRLRRPTKLNFSSFWPIWGGFAKNGVFWGFWGLLKNCNFLIIFYQFFINFFNFFNNINKYPFLSIFIKKTRFFDVFWRFFAKKTRFFDVFLHFFMFFMLFHVFEKNRFFKKLSKFLFFLNYQIFYNPITFFVTPPKKGGYQKFWPPPSDRTPPPHWGGGLCFATRERGLLQNFLKKCVRIFLKPGGWCKKTKLRFVFFNKTLTRFV